MGTGSLVSAGAGLLQAAFGRNPRPMSTNPMANLIAETTLGIASFGIVPLIRSLQGPKKQYDPLKELKIMQGLIETNQANSLAFHAAEAEFARKRRGRLPLSSRSGEYRQAVSSHTQNIARHYQLFGNLTARDVLRVVAPASLKKAREGKPRGGFVQAGRRGITVEEKLARMAAAPPQFGPPSSPKRFTLEEIQIGRKKSRIRQGHFPPVVDAGGWWRNPLRRWDGEELPGVDYGEPFSNNRATGRLAPHIVVDGKAYFPRGRMMLGDQWREGWWEHGAGKLDEPLLDEERWRSQLASHYPEGHLDPVFGPPPVRAIRESGIVQAPLAPPVMAPAVQIQPAPPPVLAPVQSAPPVMAPAMQFQPAPPPVLAPVQSAPPVMAPATQFQPGPPPVVMTQPVTPVALTPNQLEVEDMSITGTPTSAWNTVIGGITDAVTGMATPSGIGAIADLVGAIRGQGAVQTAFNPMGVGMPMLPAPAVLPGGVPASFAPSVQGGMPVGLELPFVDIVGQGAGAITQPFHTTSAGNQVAQPFVKSKANGKTEWFIPAGQPKTWSKASVKRRHRHAHHHPR